MIIAQKIQAVLGGNVKLITSGSAPISVEVMDFLKIAFAADVIEGQFSFYSIPSFSLTLSYRVRIQFQLIRRV